MGYRQDKPEPIVVGDRVTIENAGKRLNGTIGFVTDIRQGTTANGDTVPEYKVDDIGWFKTVSYYPDQETIKQRAAYQRSLRDDSRDKTFEQFKQEQGYE